MPEPLRLKVSRGFTLLLLARGNELRATVEEHPRVSVRASTVDLAVQGAREGVARLLRETT